MIIRETDSGIWQLIVTDETNDSHLKFDINLNTNEITVTRITRSYKFWKSEEPEKKVLRTWKKDTPITAKELLYTLLKSFHL